jgi:hypothetical protein
MQEVTNHRSIDAVLIELQQVLHEERDALLSLDATQIDALNSRKLSLDKELATYDGDWTDSQQFRLEGLKQKLRNNLILLMHARDHIHSRLGIESAPVVSRPTSKPAVGGNRLNLRG